MRLPVMNGRNRVAVVNIRRTNTQGSFPLRGTTLGFEPESRWDSACGISESG
jgi:hypothetical protein